MFTLAGFSLDFTVSEGETPHPDFEKVSDGYAVIQDLSVFPMK